ncbi:MAG: response regulator, partial [SAR324 cluster bacterium]|nr:response regulator [SAR324 cluster bacterium]
MINILIVDDDRFFIQNLRQQIAECGYSSKYAVNPSFVLPLLEKETFDLILMDINMPEMDGIMLLKQLKSHPVYKRIPVIMLTMETDDQSLVTCLNNGAMDYINKPVNKLALEARINAALRTIEYETWLEKKYHEEWKQRIDLTRKLQKNEKLIHQWEILPGDIQSSLQQTLDNFENNADFVDKELIAVLIQMTGQYGDNLSNFLKLSRKRDAQTIEQRNARVALLKNIPLFQSLNVFDLAILSERMEALDATEDMELLVQNAPAGWVYFIGSGIAEILVNGEIVAHRKAGDSIGEMSCLRSEPNASATVRMVDAGTVFRIERTVFMELINRLPPLWKSVFMDATNRLNQLSHRLSELSQHTAQGIVKIDPQGKITSDFSSPCIKVFGTKSLIGKNLEDLMFPEDPIVQEGWRQAYPLFFENALMDYEMLAEMMPRETVIVHEGVPREYKLSYYPCRNAEKILTGIDIEIEDITEERKLSRETEALKREQYIVEKIYNDPDSYMQMLLLMEDNLTMLRQFSEKLTSNAMAQLKEDTVELMRLLHTLKGVSSLFGLDRAKAITHQLEEFLRSSINSPSVLKTQLIQGTVDLTAQCDYARELLEKIDPDLRKRLIGVVFSNDDFADLKKSLQSRDYGRVETLVLSAEKVSLKKLAQHWPAEIRKLETALGKQVKLIIEGENVQVSRTLFQKLDGPLVHLLRNCMDHGLETVEERLEKGK